MSSDVSAQTGSALYYPYIRVRDFELVGSALLYWDRVRRIVPSSMRVGNHAQGDNTGTLRLADEGLLIATDPTPYEEGAADRFFKHIEPRAEEFRLTPEEARHFATRQRGIHIEKLGKQVIARLQELHLGHAVGDWVGMHDQVGELYMYYLASEIGTRVDAPLLAHSRTESSFGQALLFEPEPGADVSDDLLRLGIVFPSPAELENAGITAEQIVDFSKKRAGERIRFRQAIQGVIDTARKISDENALADYVGTHALEIQAAISDLRKTFDELHVGAVNSVAAITVPTGLSAALVALPFSPVVAAILATIGLAISAIACMAETRGKLRSARTAAPYHYVLSVESEFAEALHGAV